MLESDGDQDGECDRDGVERRFVEPRDAVRTVGDKQRDEDRARARRRTAPRRGSSTRLSVNSCRTSRPCPAPSALRTAISRTRAAPRASSRFETLPQAMSRTKPTAPSRTSRSSRAPPTIPSISGVARSSRSASSFGNRWRRLAAIAASCWSACCIDTPSRSRP